MLPVVAVGADAEEKLVRKGEQRVFIYLFIFIIYYLLFCLFLLYYYLGRWGRSNIEGWNERTGGDSGKIVAVDHCITVLVEHFLLQRKHHRPLSRKGAGLATTTA
jgi:hypothetical protein